MKWKIKKFTELSTRDLYEIYKARIDVFVVEQNCAFADVDEKDLTSLHLMCQDEFGKIIAYARIIATKQDTMIGRVLVRSEYRKSGMGKMLMEKALLSVACRYPEKDIRIQGQSYLKKFYESFGFVRTSDEYLEDGIGHYDMEINHQEVIKFTSHKFSGL